jgi:hypothetical protein
MTSRSVGLVEAGRRAEERLSEGKILEVKREGLMLQQVREASGIIGIMAITVPLRAMFFKHFKGEEDPSNLFIV